MAEYTEDQIPEEFIEDFNSQANVDCYGDECYEIHDLKSILHFIKDMVSSLKTKVDDDTFLYTYTYEYENEDSQNILVEVYEEEYYKPNTNIKYKRIVDKIKIEEL